MSDRPHVPEGSPEADPRAVYTVEVIIPTARFVFSLAGGRVEVLPEHDSPQAFRDYRALKEERRVVGMTTFPNTVLLRGPQTILVDPGLDLQNQPVVAAVAERGLTPADLDMVLLTHAHSDHVGGVADLDPDTPVVVHEAELRDPLWPVVSGMLCGRALETLTGDGGELLPGLRWLHTPGHSAGSVSFLVETAEGLAVLAGDTIGPLPEDFEAMRPPFPGPAGEQLVAAWERLRALEPALIVPGHIPPFTLR